MSKHGERILYIKQRKRHDVPARMLQISENTKSRADYIIFGLKREKIPGILFPAEYLVSGI